MGVLYFSRTLPTTSGPGHHQRRSQSLLSAQHREKPGAAVCGLRPRSIFDDVKQAADLLLNFSRCKTFADFTTDPLLRSAIERQFEIIGEALNQLSRVDAETVSAISEHRRIIAFRNILIHGYAEIDPRLVWGILEGKLPDLHRQVEDLLAKDLNF